jgi:putative transposase
MKVGPSEAEPFWTEFLRSLNRRGLRGVKLVISDDSHEGIKAAASKVLKATWQRCRVHFMRNALAHAGKGQRRMVSRPSTRCSCRRHRGGGRAVAHRG